MAQSQTIEDSSQSTVNFGTIANSDAFKYNGEVYFKMNEVLRLGATKNAWKWPDGTFHELQSTDQVIDFDNALLKLE